MERLQYITGGWSGTELIDEVTAAIDAGCRWIQFRAKHISDSQFLDIGKELRRKCRNNEAVFIVNDRVLLARELDAEGVHLGQDDMKIPEARQILGPGKIIGGTANTLIQCKNLELEKVDYIGLGPYRQTLTKANLSPILGLSGFLQIVPKELSYGWQILAINTPVIAIGGLNLQDIGELTGSARIHGVAVSGLIRKAQDKKGMVQNINQIFKANGHQ